MKHLAFFMSSMRVAGIEKSVQRIINRLFEIDSNLDITLYLIQQEGKLLEELDNRCKVCVLPLKDSDAKKLLLGGFKTMVIYYAKHLRFISMLRIIIRRILKRKLDWDLINWDLIPIINSNYDFAVCCTSHMPFLVRFVSEKVVSKRKILFVHSDFDINKYRIDLMVDYINNYDSFCCVSQSLLSQFTRIFPNLKDSTHVVHNYFPGEEIKRLSLLDIDIDGIANQQNGTINILTVGNFTPEKGHDLAFQCIDKLKDADFSFTWTFIGSGQLADRYKKRIKAKGLSNVYIITGITNPYPFFAKCDLYVQTSKTEGFCTTVLEAKSFNKPIICTDVPGSHELLDDYTDGIILKTNGVDELTNCIRNHISTHNSASFSFEKYNEEIDGKIKNIFMLDV